MKSPFGGYPSAVGLIALLAAAATAALATPVRAQSDDPVLASASSEYFAARPIRRLRPPEPKLRVTTDSTRTEVMVWADLAPATAPEPRLPNPQTRLWQTGMFRQDRLQHASAALTVGLATGLMTRDRWAAASGGITAGIAKELWDQRRTGFDMLDLAADLLGTAIATAATAALVR